MKLAVCGVTLIYSIVALVIFNKVTTASERRTITGGIGTPAEIFTLHVHEGSRELFKHMYFIDTNSEVLLTYSLDVYAIFLFVHV